ncbi:MAG: phosphotransferase [Pseudomonadota bacterium]
MTGSLRLSDAERASARQDFLDEIGWAGAQLEAFPGDASTRRYFRVRTGDRAAILMDAPAASEAPLAPVGADETERATLGYNALARLAGNNVTAFAGLSEALVERGFSAPRILAGDIEAGLLLIEDLGEALFARELAAGRAHEGSLYAAAVDALAALYRCSFPERFEYAGDSWLVHAYDQAAKRAEAGLFVDWYAPERGGAKLDDAARSSFDAIWTGSLGALDAHAPGLALRDYHAENLIWLPDREPMARVGLLDFQDALFAHPAYDLVSLIEDARRDVSSELAEPLKDRFFKAALLSDRAAFQAAYAVAGAQRNAKILGIFVRLAKRDGKSRYLQLLGRVARHFVHNLAHPVNAPLRAWCEAYAPGVFDEAAS